MLLSAKSCLHAERHSTLHRLPAAEEQESIVLIRTLRPGDPPKRRKSVVIPLGLISPERGCRIERERELCRPFVASYAVYVGAKLHQVLMPNTLTTDYTQ